MRVDVLSGRGDDAVMRQFVLSIVLVLMVSGSASAASLNVVGGQLLDASGVAVGGNLYDVQFMDGTCIDLYDGCDEASDFTFTDFASASLAAQALLDQVFLDGASGSFDTSPHLTTGCETTTECYSHTPYEVAISNLQAALAFNGYATGERYGDGAPITWNGVNTFASDEASLHNYAVWTHTRTLCQKAA